MIKNHVIKPLTTNFPLMHEISLTGQLTGLYTKRTVAVVGLISQ